MISDSTWLLIGTSVLAYFIGASVHVGIDYVHGKRMLRQYWDKTDLKIAGIQEDVITGLEQKLGSRLNGPVVDVAGGFDAFLSSEQGKQWALELGDVITEAWTTRMTQKAGGVAKKTQAKMARALVEGIKFDHPVMDGLWAFLPLDNKLQFARRLAKVIHRIGIDQLGDIENASDEQLLAIEAPAETEAHVADWPPRT